MRCVIYHSVVDKTGKMSYNGKKYKERIYLDVFLSIISLIAGLGVFMAGMKMLSDGLERSAGSGMRKLFGKISNNRFAGVGVGALATMIVNSSSATTVMVIGFVNAGLMTLFQATAIIMGANIGTTFTGIIIGLSGFDSGFKITDILALLTFIGIIISMFAKHDKLKRIGSAITGIGLMFVSLSLMSGAFNNQTMADGVQKLLKAVNFPLLLILIGMAFTALFQSSAAMTAIVVTMAAPVVGGDPIISMSSALFVMLGTNIGTCITAILASIGASTNAKRTAVIHLLFNFIGTVIFTIFIWIFRDGAVWLLEQMMPGNPQMQVALFHVFFNVITTALLLPFIKPLTKLATALVRDKRGGKNDEPHMYFVDDRFLQTPPIAVAQVKREVDHMGEMAKSNLERAMNAVLNLDVSAREEVAKQEQCINFVHKGLTKYLIKLSSLSLGRTDEKFVGSLFRVVSDIERIADYAKNFIDDADEMIQSDCKFTQEAADELVDMYDKVIAMFDEAMYIFENNAVSKLPEFSAREEDMDMTKRVLANNHIERLNSGGCSVESGTHFYSIISSLERIADHLTNIAFSIKSPTGSQREAMEKIAEEQKRRSHERKSKAQAEAAVADGNAEKDKKGNKGKKSKKGKETKYDASTAENNDNTLIAEIAAVEQENISDGAETGAGEEDAK